MMPFIDQGIFEYCVKDDLIFVKQERVEKPVYKCVCV